LTVNVKRNALEVHLQEVNFKAHLHLLSVKASGTQYYLLKLGNSIAPVRLPGSITGFQDQRRSRKSS
jgi:hypothetical protein